VDQFINALLLGAGYNAALVCIGAALLGFSAGTAGTFLVLRKRSLVCKAAANATLPGIVLAFIVMALLGGDGRNIFGLMAGATVTALLGITAIDWIAKNTRLQEDTAIGIVLSVSFGIGLVLLTIIQYLGIGRPSGLEKLLLGSISGMLYKDAIIIVIGSTLISAITFLLRRSMTLVAFDPEYAAVRGYNVRIIDLTILTLGVAITVVGLKIVGLILVIGLLIIPPVTARYWTVRPDYMLLIAGIVGAIAAYVGVAISASAPNLPAGPMIILVATAFFAFSMLFAPGRGLVVVAYEAWELSKRALAHEGLLALGRGEKIKNAASYFLLYIGGIIAHDQRLTTYGTRAMAQYARDERRWQIGQALYSDMDVISYYYAFKPLGEVFTEHQITKIDRVVRKIAHNKEQRKNEQRAKTLVYLANKRDEIKAESEKRIEPLFKQVFSNHRQAVDAYADWLFRWSTNWALLWKGGVAATQKILCVGISPIAIRQAAKRAVQDYLIEQYTSRVHKSKIREPEISIDLELILENARAEYRQVLARLDDRFQRCVQKQTLQNSKDYCAHMSIQRNWQAQTMSMPNLMSDRASARSLTSATVMIACMLSGLIIEAFAGVIDLGWANTVLGMKIPIIGLIVCAAIGASADYILNRWRRKLERERFVTQNLSTIYATSCERQQDIVSQANSSIDTWFGDIQKAIAKT